MDNEMNIFNTAVIGGGVSGILALKYLKDQGIKAVLYEKNCDLKGV
jgi:cation diffusion facilitator CzcD-associated flavoprotein CzcO